VIAAEGFRSCTGWREFEDCGGTGGTGDPGAGAEPKAGAGDDEFVDVLEGELSEVKQELQRRYRGMSGGREL